MELTSTDIMMMTTEQIRQLNDSVGYAFTTQRITQKETPACEAGVKTQPKETTESCEAIVCLVNL
jgi:hypothetical protein